MPALSANRFSAPTNHVNEAATTLGRRVVEWLAAEHEFALREETFSALIGDPALKSACDICLLLWCRAVVLAPPLDEYYRPLCDSVLRMVASPEYARTLRAHPRAPHVYGLLYAAARALGSDNKDARSVLAEVVMSRVPVNVERLPYQQLDLLHFLESIELGPAELDTATVAATTLLARQLDPAKLLPADAYIIAHTIFYLTDFGRRPLVELTRTAETTRDIVLKLLNRFQASDHADLTAELAAALACLDSRVTPPVVDALTYLKTLQRPDGTIALARELVSLTAGSSLHARRTWWFQHCHAAVATALLATIVEGRLARSHD